MFVCHCEAVTDREVRDAICTGAADPVAVAARTGASTNCGVCLETVHELLEQEGRDPHRHLTAHDVAVAVESLVARAQEAVAATRRPAPLPGAAAA